MCVQFQVRKYSTAVYGGQGNVRRVVRRPERERQRRLNLNGQPDRGFRHHQDVNAVEQLQTGPRRLGIAGGAFIQHQLRNDQFEIRAPRLPPLPTETLVGCPDHVAARPGRQVAGDRRLDVDPRPHAAPPLGRLPRFASRSFHGEAIRTSARADSSFSPSRRRIEERTDGAGLGRLAQGLRVVFEQAPRAPLARAADAAEDRHQAAAGVLP